MLKKYSNTIKILLILILLAYCLKKIIPSFYAGAYPFSTVYEISIKDSLLIKKIEIFKVDNPSYIVPKQCELFDHIDKSYNNLFIIYFYYKKENKIVRIWVTSSGKNMSKLGVVGVNRGLEIGNWQLLNNDLDNSETKEELSLFEHRILKKLDISFERE
jgi:hypothetical protein